MIVLLLLLLLVIASLVVDWGQTCFIARNPHEFTEINLILGKHPSVRAVDIYFECCIALTLAGAYWLPFWWAVSIGVAVLVLEVYITIRNQRHGVRIEF